MKIFMSAFLQWKIEYLANKFLFDSYKGQHSHLKAVYKGFFQRWGAMLQIALEIVKSETTKLSRQYALI